MSDKAAPSARPAVIRRFRKKENTVRGHESFKRILSTRTYFTSDGLRLYYRPSNEQWSYVKAGFAVTRNLRSATQRNRVKRLLRESWGQLSNICNVVATEANLCIEIVFLYTDTTQNKELNLKKMIVPMRQLIRQMISKIESNR